MSPSKKGARNSFHRAVPICAALLLAILALQCSAATDELDKLLFPILGDSDVARPTITYVSPVADAREVGINAPVVIGFSKPMDQIFTETALGLSANGGETAHRIDWISDRVMQVTFRPSLTNGKRYEVRLNATSVRDENGNYLATNFLTHFYTAGSNGLPFVASSNPPSTSGVVTGWPIAQNPTVTFSEPMDPAKTNNAISISGGAAIFVHSWDPSYTTCTLNLLSPLQVATSYNLTVGSGATSQGGVATGSTYTALFNTGTDSIRPDVGITATPNGPVWPVLAGIPTLNSITGVSKRDSFLFTFSEPMNQTASLAAISFTPAIDGQFNWLTPAILEFRPTSYLVQNTWYRLSVSGSATDLAGLSLVNDYVVDFRVDNAADSTALSLVNIDGFRYNPPDAADAGFTAISPSAGLEYAVNANTGATPYEYRFDLKINTAGGAALKTSGTGDVFSAIGFEYHGGGPSTAPPNIIFMDYTPTGNPQTVQVRIRGFNQGVRYRMRLRGGSDGLRDVNENYLPQDLVFIFYRP